MIRISVNINKIATIRNARGGNLPDICKAALDCEKFGADGITVHPRPDERHVRYDDVRILAPVLTTEFNIEGYPIPQFMDLVTLVRPAQVTLVPDAHDVITSDQGWDTVQNESMLKEVIRELRKNGIRVSLFVNADRRMVEHAAAAGADRVELYTGPYASMFEADPRKAIKPYISAAQTAQDCALGLNAGHDLNLRNLGYFAAEIPGLMEVSIGHALISDALYWGLETTIKKYKDLLSHPKQA